MQNSLNVYNCLVAKKDSPVWRGVFNGIKEDSLIIMSLLHDLCKTNFYVKGTKNQKTYDKDKVGKAERWQIKHDDKGDFIWETVDSYEIDDTMPLGHGEKSVIMIMQFMSLEIPELYAIRWHMGFSEEKAQWKAMGDSMEKYPIVLALHEADLEASKILEVDR